MIEKNSISPITEENVYSKLEGLSEEEKELLLDAMKDEASLCPYPDDKLYVEIRQKYKDQPKQQEMMKKNIGPMIDGKREIVPMKKNFSMLTVQHNGKDIFDGNHVDQYGNTGVKLVTYLTGEAAEKEVKNQGKKLLKDKSEVVQLINFFPGENTEEKIFNFIKFFGLEKKAGYWNPLNKKWNDVGSVGYVKLSKVNGSSNIYGVAWGNDYAHIDRNDQEFPSSFLAYEDC